MIFGETWVLRFGLFVVLTFVNLGLSGCGGKTTGTVAGTVSYRGQPVTQGEVQFFSKERGVGATAKIDNTGKFAFDTPLDVGTYAVAVAPPPPEPGAPGSKPTGGAKGSSNIPAKYRDPSKSDLKVTVSGGKNEIALEMKD